MTADLAEVTAQLGQQILDLQLQLTKLSAQQMDLLDVCKGLADLSQQQHETIKTLSAYVDAAIDKHLKVTNAPNHKV